MPIGISMQSGLFCWRQALCTEASLRALRRRYPQIYKAEQKLLLDPRQVSVDRRDFLAAFSAIVPASHRSAAAHARCVHSSAMMRCCVTQHRTLPGILGFRLQPVAPLPCASLCNVHVAPADIHRQAICPDGSALLQHLCLTFHDAVCRPLPGLAAPVLKRHLEQILGNLARSFPPAAACLQATAAGGGIAPGAMLSEGAVLEDSDDEAEGGSPMQPWLLCLPVAIRLRTRFQPTRDELCTAHSPSFIESRGRWSHLTMFLPEALPAAQELQACQLHSRLATRSCGRGCSSAGLRGRARRTSRPRCCMPWRACRCMPLACPPCYRTPVPGGLPLLMLGSCNYD